MCLCLCVVACERFCCLMSVDVVCEFLCDDVCCVMCNRCVCSFNVFVWIVCELLCNAV